MAAITVEECTFTGIQIPLADETWTRDIQPNLTRISVQKTESTANYTTWQLKCNAPDGPGRWSSTRQFNHGFWTAATIEFDKIDYNPGEEPRLVHFDGVSTPTQATHSYGSLTDYHSGEVASVLVKDSIKLHVQRICDGELLNDTYSLAANVFTAGSQLSSNGLLLLGR